MNIVTPNLKASIAMHTRLYKLAEEGGNTFIMQEQEEIINDLGKQLKRHVGFFPCGTPDFTERHHAGKTRA